MAESDEIRENLGLIAMQREMLRELRDENERLRHKLGWLAWNVACIEDKSARRPIEAHELEERLRELGEDTFRAAQAEAFKEIKRREIRVASTEESR